MMKAFKLGYANFSVKNVDAMVQYYTHVMGYAVVERGEDGRVYLSNHIDHHHIVLTSAQDSALHSVGLQVTAEDSLDKIAEYLRREGLAAEYKTDAQPGVSEQIDVVDPSGTTVELYTDMAMSGPGFQRAGILPTKLGHITIFAKDKDKTVDFYTQYLKFAITDRMEERVTFMTCNQDHHVLNFKVSDRTYMHHIAFELRDMIHMKNAHDLLTTEKIDIVWGPTRHTAGHNVASYHYDPEHFMIELFCDMDVYVPELGYFEPRPWHGDQPQKPKVWTAQEGLSRWETKFFMDLSKG